MAIPNISVKNIAKGDGISGFAQLLPGEQYTSAFTIKQPDKPVRRSLHICGCVEGTEGGEERFRDKSYLLRDAAVIAGNGEYAVHIEGQKNGLSQMVYLLIKAPQFEWGGDFCCDFKLNATDFASDSAEPAGLKIEFFDAECGRDEVLLASPRADYFVPFDAGSYDWKTFCGEFRLPAEPSAMLISIGGCDLSGGLTISLPRISQNGICLEIPRYHPESEEWLCSNVSQAEWPQLSILIDDDAVFSASVFHRAANRFRDFEISLPDLAAGRHELTFVFDRGYGNYYSLDEINLLEEAVADFEIIGVPAFVPEQAEFSVMIEVNEDDCRLEISATDGAQPVADSLVCKTQGLYAVKCKAGTAGSSPEIIITSKSGKACAEVTMVTFAEGDGILLSTSDWIYIGYDQFVPYLKWMYANNIMNAVVIRPSYQWNGTRHADEEFFRKAKGLFASFNLYYALMSEGRCLPGCSINPEDEWLQGDYYLGRQAHEDDGSYNYWGRAAPYRNETLLRLMERYLDSGGIFPVFRFDDAAACNMQEASEYFVHNLKRAKSASTRHTGPSVLFRYFYQAGYEWLGAEQFYGPEEIVLSALRGASKVYGKSRYGTHHATQWGSPHTWEVEAQYKSHAVAYLHGSSHINTEDGLWNTENCNHRFSPETIQHVERQRDMMDFIKTHRRSGEMIVKIAVLQGKYDGWACFGEGNLWGQDSPEWEQGAAEESYDLLKVFYPRESLHGFSVGGTPFGPVDLLPIEASADILQTYDALVFLGWNTYDDEQFSQLLSFVKNGGTLLLTRAHLNANLTHNSAIVQPSKSEFCDFLNSYSATVADSQAPAVHITAGKGRIVFFDTDKYPADANIRSAYEKEMRVIGEACLESERNCGWARGSDNIGFTVWDTEFKEKKIRRIFLLNYSDDEVQSVNLLVRKSEFTVDIAPKSINTVYVFSGIAVLLSDPLADVLDIEKAAGKYTVTFFAVNHCYMTLFSEDGSARKVDIACGISRMVLLK